MSAPQVKPEHAPAAGPPFRVLSFVAATHSVTHMFFALMPVIYPYLMSEFGFSYTQLGLMVGTGSGHSHSAL